MSDHDLLVERVRRARAHHIGECSDARAAADAVAGLQAGVPRLAVQRRAPGSCAASGLLPARLDASRHGACRRARRTAPADGYGEHGEKRSQHSPYITPRDGMRSVSCSARRCPAFVELSIRAGRGWKHVNTNSILAEEHRPEQARRRADEGGIRSGRLPAIRLARLPAPSVTEKNASAAGLSSSRTGQTAAAGALTLRSGARGG